MNIQQEKDEASLHIVYYTDPLCCWSWAFEPQWRRLRYEFGRQIRWRYCMGGLLPNWDTFNDPMNAINRPVQMGPLWLEAKYMSGMPIQDQIWITDPPSSSYPACIAVKCAGLQSAEAEEIYLRRLREAVMLHTKNIAQQQVLIDVATTLTQNIPGILDIDIFKNDLKNGNGYEAFRNDLQKASYHKISRFPTLTISAQNKAVMIVGYRPYSVLLQAIAAVMPDMVPEQQTINAADYIRYWHGTTNREVEEFIEVNNSVKNKVNM